MKRQNIKTQNQDNQENQLSLGQLLFDVQIESDFLT